MEDKKLKSGAGKTAPKNKKDKSHYISSAESRAIAKENFRTTRRLEKRKKRKNVAEIEFVTEIHDPQNVVEFDDLHTYFFTDAGTVKAVDGVSFSIPQGSTVGVVGESGCGKSVTSLSLMQLVQAPQGQIVSGSIRFRTSVPVRGYRGEPVPVYVTEERADGGKYPVLRPTDDEAFTPAKTLTEWEKETKAETAASEYGGTEKDEAGINDDLGLEPDEIKETGANNADSETPGTEENKLNEQSFGDSERPLCIIDANGKFVPTGLTEKIYCAEAAGVKKIGNKKLYPAPRRDGKGRTLYASDERGKHIPVFRTSEGGKNFAGRKTAVTEILYTERKALTTKLLYPLQKRDASGAPVFTRDVSGNFVPVYLTDDEGQPVYLPVKNPYVRGAIFAERTFRPVQLRDERGRLVFEGEGSEKKPVFEKDENGKDLETAVIAPPVKKVKLKFTAPVLVSVRPGASAGECVTYDGELYVKVPEESFDLKSVSEGARVLRAVIETDCYGNFLYEKRNGEFVPVYSIKKDGKGKPITGEDGQPIVEYRPAARFVELKPRHTEPVALLIPVIEKEDNEFDRYVTEDKTFDIAKMPISEMRRLRGKEISMIFQEPMTSLNPVFTIGYQMDEVVLLHTPGATKQSAKARSIEMLNLVGIAMAERVYKSYPHELSGGMRQRVMIAMALACNPKLIIADEPTTALDVTIQAQILDLLREIKHKINGSIMLITHDLGVIAEMADFVVVMYAGRIVEMGTAKEIFDNPMHPYTIGLQKSKPVVNKKVDRLYSIRGQVPNPINMPHYCYFRDRCDRRCDACTGEYPPLIKVSDTHSVSCYLYGKDGGRSK